LNTPNHNPDTQLTADVRIKSRLTDLSNSDLYTVLLPAGEQSRSGIIISIEIRLDIFVQEGGLSSGP
jgi:hypothetical protein